MNAMIMSLPISTLDFSLCSKTVNLVNESRRFAKYLSANAIFPLRGPFIGESNVACDRDAAVLTEARDLVVISAAIACPGYLAADSSETA